MGDSKKDSLEVHGKFSTVKPGNTEDIPKDLWTLIKPEKNKATIDEVMDALRDYIWDKKLFDPQQMKVKCKGDALAEVLRCEEFTILEIKNLLQGFVYLQNCSEKKIDNPPETKFCQDRSPFPLRETVKRKAEETFEGIKPKKNERRQCGHLECSETLSCLHLKFSPVCFLHIPESPIEIPSESEESIQDVETSFVTDSSDESIYFDEDSSDKGHFLPSGSILTVAETFEVEFEPNSSFESDSLYSDSDSSEWDSVVDLDSIITVVCKTDEDKEFFADISSDEDPEFFKSDRSMCSDDDFDDEISEFDLWRCSRCKRMNNPKNRFCMRCMGTREDWLPEKKAPEKIPNFKRKPRSKRKRLRKGRENSSKCLKEDSSKCLDLPSTSEEKSPSHEDFNLEKNQIPLSPFLKISEHKKNMDKKKLCLFCCEMPINSALIHGKLAHSIGCYVCSKRFKRCPVCRRAIEKVVYLIS